MAKRFFYVSFGILCLVAAYQVGAQKARADWSVGLVGQVLGCGAAGTIYDAQGQAWQALPGTGFTRLVVGDLPIEVGDVKAMGFYDLVSQADEVWHWVGGGTGWSYVGLFPGGPVALDDASWGKVKGAYR